MHWNVFRIDPESGSHFTSPVPTYPKSHEGIQRPLALSDDKPAQVPLAPFSGVTKEDMEHAESASEARKLVASRHGHVALLAVPIERRKACKHISYPMPIHDYRGARPAVRVVRVSTATAFRANSTYNLNHNSHFPSCRQTHHRMKSSL